MATERWSVWHRVGTGNEAVMLSISSFNLAESAAFEKAKRIAIEDAHFTHSLPRVEILRGGKLIAGWAKRFEGYGVMWPFTVVDGAEVWDKGKVELSKCVVCDLCLTLGLVCQHCGIQYAIVPEGTGVYVPKAPDAEGGE